jgi:hypothetical protein
MEAKLKRRKKASVSENAQTMMSIHKIDQRGMLCFQKKFKSLYMF